MTYPVSSATVCQKKRSMSAPTSLGLTFESGNFTLDRAFAVAYGDLLGNVKPYQAGILPAPTPCLLAGLSYHDPWTRDAAINTWNGAGLLLPSVMRSTLLSVLEDTGEGPYIAGQYWDAIIWTIGAWAYYQYIGEINFLRLAFTATRNTIQLFEATEFDADYHLFRGPACYGDGVSAYDDRYANCEGSTILDWPIYNLPQCAPNGVGLPMMALSTNCLYEHAYRLIHAMTIALHEPSDPQWLAKAQQMREAINRHFWDDTLGHYRYYLDPFGGCDVQEGLGHAFALLFAIADPWQAERVLQRQHVTAAGIPCLYPVFTRYMQIPGNQLTEAIDEAIANENWMLSSAIYNYSPYGRHSGTVWPHIQGFWAEAALKHGRPDRFEYELMHLSRHIARDVQCAEIYHPEGGLPYGGVQEDSGHPLPRRWSSCYRQSWSATALMRMVLFGLFGMHFEEDGARFHPYLPANIPELRLHQLPFRQAELSLIVRGQGHAVTSCHLDGQPLPDNVVPYTVRGRHTLEITMA